MSVSGISSGQIKAAASQSASSETSIFGEIWDTINPLQHIPIVSSLYRAVSDTPISSFANIAGSTLYGGPIGGAVAAVSEGVSALSDAVFGDTKTASATTPPKPAIPAQTQPQNKLHSSTNQFLNKHLSELETASGVNNNLVAHKILATTSEWLNKSVIASAGLSA